MKFVDISINNRITVLFALTLVVVGGIYAYFHLGKLEDPEFSIKTALIVTPYLGASPHEVEQQVTRVVEEAVQKTAEVETIRSVSRAGKSMVYVDLYEHNWTQRIQQEWDVLRRKVQECQGKLPTGAGPSIVFDDYSNVYGIFLAMSGDGFTYAELKEYADVVQRELVLVDNVARVDLFGARRECIEVEISRAKCATLGVHPKEIVEILNGQNEIVGAGAIEYDDSRLRIAVSGVFNSHKDIGELVVQQTDNQQILLKDLARITRSYIRPSDPMMRFNGRMAIGIAVAAISGANVVTMGDDVQTRIDNLMNDLPVGLNIDGVYYQSKFVKDAIKKFMTNLLQSIGIVIAVLLVFMGFRSGLIIAGNLVFSILATLVIMLIWGIDLQRISLAALILVMGMIVDNAIVVTDGTLVQLKKGGSLMDAVRDPARQTAWPLLAATVIACLAFMPIYMAKNNTGEYCGSLFQVVAIALMTSWLLAMSQTPVFCLYLLKASKTGGQTESHTGMFYRIYRSLLDATLRRRPLTLLVMTAFLILGILGFGMVSKIFFADSDKAQFFIDYRRPESAPIQAVSRDLLQVEQYLKSFSEIKNFATCIGQGSPRFASSITPEPPTACFGQIIVNVHDYRGIDNLTEQLERWFPEHLPEGEPHIWKYIAGPKADYRVEARFSGPDPKVLRSLAEKAKAIMRADPMAKNVCDDWRERAMILDFTYAQRKARMAGVERRHLAESLMSQTDGLIVTWYREKDDLIPVKMIYSAISPDNLEATPVWGRKPVSVPLGQIIEANDITWEDPIVRRYDRRRMIRAQCDPIQGATSDTLLKRIGPAIESLELPPGYTLEWEGEYELSKKANEGVNQFLPVALICMAFILVALFNAIHQPIIIALTLPFALVGMTVGLLLCRQPFGFLAMLGAYSLMGMLIKNAVVLIDQIDSEIRDGKPPLEAVKDSSVSRMRPVMMAALTTILGMLPLLTDATFVSMAVTIMFGLAFATLLTLICVPVLYTLFFRICT